MSHQGTRRSQRLINRNLNIQNELNTNQSIAASANDHPNNILPHQESTATIAPSNGGSANNNESSMGALGSNLSNSSSSFPAVRPSSGSSPSTILFYQGSTGSITQRNYTDHGGVIVIDLTGDDDDDHGRGNNVNNRHHNLSLGLSLGGGSSSNSAPNNATELERGNNSGGDRSTAIATRILPFKRRSPDQGEFSMGESSGTGAQLAGITSRRRVNVNIAPNSEDIIDANNNNNVNISTSRPLVSEAGTQTERFQIQSNNNNNLHVPPPTSANVTSGAPFEHAPLPNVSATTLQGSSSSTRWANAIRDISGPDQMIFPEVHDDVHASEPDPTRVNNNSRNMQRNDVVLGLPAGGGGGGRGRNWGNNNPPPASLRISANNANANGNANSVGNNGNFAYPSSSQHGASNIGARVPRHGTVLGMLDSERVEELDLATVTSTVNAARHANGQNSGTRSDNNVAQASGDANSGGPPRFTSLALANSEMRRRLANAVRDALQNIRAGRILQFEELMILDYSIVLHLLETQQNNPNNNQELNVQENAPPIEGLLPAQPPENVNNGEIGLSEDEILKHLRYENFQPSADDTPGNIEACSICQEEYVDGEEVARLDCVHRFHEECIKQWLMLKNVCPICKQTGLVVEEEAENA